MASENPLLSDYIEKLSMEYEQYRINDYLKKEFKEPFLNPHEKFDDSFAIITPQVEKIIYNLKKMKI